MTRRRRGPYTLNYPHAWSWERIVLRLQGAIAALAIASLLNCLSPVATTRPAEAPTTPVGSR